MRRLFISADMEGCAAVAAPQALLPERWIWEWSAARQWMTGEVVAAAEAGLAGGYDEVIVADGHGNSHNIDPDRLPDNVRLVRSYPRPLLQMQGVEEEHVDMCAFIGYHAGPSAPSGILAHAFSGFAYHSIWLNGEPCSEGYINAALAGEYGKPVFFISGDQQAVDDSHRYAPQATRLVTKETFGFRSQMSLPPRQVHQLLRNSFSDALNAPRPKPFVLQGPYRLELAMTSQVAAEMLAYLPRVERTGAFSVASTFDTLATAMRFITFTILYTPTGVPAF